MYTMYFMEKIASQCANCKSTIHSLYWVMGRGWYVCRRLSKQVWNSVYVVLTLIIQISLSTVMWTWVVLCCFVFQALNIFDLSPMWTWVALCQSCSSLSAELFPHLKSARDVWAHQLRTFLWIFLRQRGIRRIWSCIPAFSRSLGLGLSRQLIRCFAYTELNILQNSLLLNIIDS